MSAAELSRRALIGSAGALAIAGRSVAATSGAHVVIAKAGNFTNPANAPGVAVSQFLGIRYGYAERFLPPQPVARPGETIIADRFGPVSPQTGDHYLPQSEDCLFLNVWTADVRPAAKRPVMVYIHGGAYSGGSVTDPLNDGALLAERGKVVVVTINHRLNVFGYLSLGRIDPRYPDSGNVGQLDLILALQWIRDNIASFGGDPANVMLFGQSGGGAKIATLMAMPAARGLFHKATTMSGQQVTASGPLNAEKRARAYLAKLGGDPVTASSAALVEALSAVDPIMGGGVYFGPVLDDRSLLRHPFYPDAAPDGRSVPLMLGNVVAETRAFFPPDNAKMIGLGWKNIAARIAPELRVDIAPERVISAYRTWFPDKSPAEIFIAATTAGRSWRGQVIEAEERARAGVPAFVYQLDFEQAKHTDDIGLVFGTSPDMTPARRSVSDRMQAAFVRFAHTGHPGWPAYDLARRDTMIFDSVSRVVSDPRGRERRLFEQVPYIQPGT